MAYEYFKEFDTDDTGTLNRKAVRIADGVSSGMADRTWKKHSRTMDRLNDGKNFLLGIYDLAKLGANLA